MSKRQSEICTVSGCDSKTYCKSMCNKHYRRARKHISKEIPPSKTYMVWQAMKQRCLNPNNKQYKDYGGRGIAVCDRWLDFKNFQSDMGEKPDGLTIDRIDNDLGYFPLNCRWTSHLVQNNNRRPKPNKYSRGISKAPYGFSVALKGVYIGHRKTLEEAIKLRDEHV